jgi:hypothetical protein
MMGDENFKIAPARGRRITDAMVIADLESMLRIIGAQG